MTCLCRMLSDSEAAVAALKADTSRGGGEVNADLAPLIEAEVRAIREDAARRISQAEDAARTAQEALRMVMSLNVNK